MPYLSASVLFAVVAMELGFLGLWIACGAERERRSHFWVRVLLASLALPSLTAGLASIAQLNVLSDPVARLILSSVFLAGVVALMLVPGLLYRTSDSSPGPSDPDDGGGPGPGPPRLSPDAPRGGVPLPNADQSTARVRDHNAPGFGELGRRRPAHEPRRRPTRTNHR